MTCDFMPLSKNGVLATLLCVGLVAACGPDEDQLRFDGKFYRAKLSKVDKQRSQFAIQVSPASASLTGAREAGRYEATRYCIAQFGTSDVTWISGPDVEDDALVLTNDKLQLRGTCAP